MQPEISDQIFYAFLTGGLCASSTSTTVTSSSDPFATVYEDKALASLRNHKEAERKRRARINSHLNKLRKDLNRKIIKSIEDKNGRLSMMKLLILWVI
ncbi:putative transcription factor bHLH family [Arabidopsis thaliana]